MAAHHPHPPPGRGHIPLYQRRRRITRLAATGGAASSEETVPVWAGHRSWRRPAVRQAPETGGVRDQGRATGPTRSAQPGRPHARRPPHRRHGTATAASRDRHGPSRTVTAASRTVTGASRQRHGTVTGRRKGCSSAQSAAGKQGGAPRLRRTTRPGRARCNDSLGQRESAGDPAATAAERPCRWPCRRSGPGGAIFRQSGRRSRPRLGPSDT